MSKITTLRMGRGRQKKVQIFLDGRRALNLEAETALKAGLEVGQELSASQIEALTSSDHLQRCLDAATRYLSYRPRSEQELKERLGQRGFDRVSVAAVLERLKERGLIDDRAFAQFWKDNREAFSPRSQGMTRLELRRKGVAGNIIDEIVGTIDDEESAYRAALGKARRLPLDDYPRFRRRLGDYLKRRGFGYGVITRTIARLWPELSTQNQ